MKDSAVVYRNFMQAVRKLPAEKRGDAYEAYMLFAMDGIEYEGDDYAIAALVETYKSTIEENRKKYENQCARADKIRKGKREVNAKSDRSQHEVSMKSEQYDCDVESDNETVTDTVTVTDSKGTKSNDLVCQAKPDILPKAEAQKIVQAWNEKAGAKGAPQVYLMSESSKRYKSLKARVQEYGIPKVLEAIDKVAESDFLCHGNSKWRGATFDWLVLPNNFSKVLEGNYSDRERASPENPLDDPDIMGYLRRKHGIR